MTTNPNPSAGPARVRIEGTVTAVHADGRFTLALPDGTDLAGIATGSQLRRLGSLIGCRALVLGFPGDPNIDGVLPVAPGTDSGQQFSPAELTEMFASVRASIGNRTEATDEEMDALLKGDR